MAIRTLTTMTPHTAATVIALKGGRAFQNRIVSLGLNIGFELEVLQSGNGDGGPVLVAVGSSRLAIGHGMADRIIVRTAGRGSATRTSK